MLLLVAVTVDLSIETFHFVFSCCLRESSHVGVAYRNGGHLLPFKISTYGAKLVLRCGEICVLSPVSFS